MADPSVVLVNRTKAKFNLPSPLSTHTLSYCKLNYSKESHLDDKAPVGIPLPDGPDLQAATSFTI